jgi:hypothetical protein
MRWLDGFGSAPAFFRLSLRLLMPFWVESFACSSDTCCSWPDTSPPAFHARFHTELGTSALLAFARLRRMLDSSAFTWRVCAGSQREGFSLGRTTAWMSADA